MNSKVLNGSQRVVMDGVISADECRELQRLTNVREASSPQGPASPSPSASGRRARLPLVAHRQPPLSSATTSAGPQLPRLSPPVFWTLQAAATSGDGYRGQTSPHTPSEKFYGVTVFKALKVESILGTLE